MSREAWGTSMLHDKTILLVDDQALIVLELETTLEDAGADVVTFGNAPEALAWLQATTPSAAVLDYRVGADTSASIAKTLSERGVPVLFYSGMVDLAHLPDELLAHEWLNKPSSPEDLIARLQALTA